MKEITITIDEQTGATTYESKGFPGPTCTVPAEIARAVLGTPTAERTTAEFTQTVRQAPKLRQHGPG